FFGGRIIEPDWFKPVTDKRFLSQLVDQTAAGKILVADLKKHGIVDYGQITRHGWSMEPKDRIPPATLNIGGQRMTLARWPNVNEESPYMVYKHYLTEDRPLQGYELTVQAIIDKVRLPGDVTLTRTIDPGGEYDRGGKGGTFEVAFDRMKYWHDIENVFLDGVLASTWEWTYNRLASVDVGKKQITLASPELRGITQGASVRLPHFYFENIPEEIDRPGEYYIDRSKGLLYLYPPKKSGTIVLSTLKAAMISIERSSDIRFQGLEFDTGRHLGFDIRRSRDITIDSCRIANFTAGGVKVDGKRVRILNSHIHGMGGFGVHLDGGNFKTLEPADNEVLNCRIHDFGWEQKSQLPAVIVNGVGHRVAHNEIYDGPHFAIRIRRVNDVLIEYNEIYDLPKYHKFDGGSLYVFSGDRAQSRGTVIRGNYFHDIPTIGVYPDNFTWGVEISHNIFRNVGVATNRPAVYVNGGGECRTFNNIMIDCVLMYGQGAREKEERWFTHWNKTLEEFGDGK
ncbi:MAG: right-handed parallel beta-helix repeat-containing protein, partial [Planctomycetes bacterium]|nr:right-handed parallel beta-helix repeat-containing protein [Planctomycetota bacterium]